jgi:glycosyltransferase involved in cell wall biosynthesis/phosphatidylglycerophosphate synthase
MGVEDAVRALSTGSADSYWVDTLHLDAVPELARANVADARIGLVVHYLPSIVPSKEVSPVLLRAERAALETAGVFLATSQYTSRVLRDLGVPPERIFVIEPGVLTDRVAKERSGSASELRAIVVANLLQPKGVRELLEALSARLPHELPFRLSVVGSLAMDVEYARSCGELVDAVPSLARRVDFLGSLPHDAVVSELRRSDVLVSASTMESYGMALAESRAVGVPIVAMRGGNVENLVGRASGGALFDDVTALVTDLVRLATDENELLRRKGLALAERRVRTWDRAADDFQRAFQDSETRGPKPAAPPREREGGRENEGQRPRRAWQRWTMGHSVGMLAVIGLAWAVHAAWISAAFGAASLLILVTLGREQWGEGAIIGWANAITLVRLAVIVAITSSSTAGPTEALGAVAVMCLDWLDGRVARRRRETSEFGAKFDMETDALFIAVVGMKLVAEGRLGAWILVPGFLRYAYAIAIGLVETRGEAPRSRFGRYVFAVQGASLAVALWPVEPIFMPLAVVATLLTTGSFARSAYWSLGVTRIHPNQRAATG